MERKVVSDAVHKRDDDPERRMEHQKNTGKGNWVRGSEEKVRRGKCGDREKVPRDVCE